ncbi:MAG: ATP-binding protein, partial [Armatimonadota bacterium]
MDLLIAFLGYSISGIIGNRTDALFCRVMQTVRERLRQGGRLVNHDLQRAVRKAYLQATLVLIDARLRELGVEPRLLQRDIRYLFRQPPEPRQLLTVRNALQRELKQLPKATYIPPTPEAEQQIELLLQPRGETAQQRTEELRALLKAQLLQELRARWRVQPSAHLQEMLQSGWQEITEQGEALTLDWFDLLCAFFAEELKQNPHVTTTFQSLLLANLSVEGVSVDYSAFIQQLEQFGGQVLQRLQQLEQTLVQLRQEQAEGFRAIEQRLDEYLPALLTRTEQVQTLLETLRIEAQRRPLYEQYAGLELAQRTEQIIRDYTTLFVGREAELERLDALFEQPSGMLLITAPAGYGKTALLANWIALRHEAGCFIAYHFFRKGYDDANRLDSIPNALYNLLRQLYIYYGLEQELPLRDEGLLRDALLGVLRERGARADEPLVLLLDGLDEAEQRLLLTLPQPLPEGVYVVASVRAGEGETPEAVSLWLCEAQRLHLQSLPRVAIADYLTRAGDGELAPYAQQAGFVELVMNKTGGYPLHLRYLVDDLLAEAKRGGDVHAALQRTPTGFNNYVREQLRHLARSLTDAPKVQQLFALLATAHGALSERELEELAGLNAFELAGLPWQATRWFSVQERAGERYYAFTHPALGDAFEQALGSLAQGARQQLLNYCARWAEHKSAYALRYYPAHLKEAGDYEALYALARDEAFLRAQREVLPAEADLPLRTLQTVLQAAIEQENPPVMAELLLRHAALTLQAETPLDALQQGSLERAIGLAKQIMERDYQIGTLWLLLLAWSCHRRGDSDGAERCLEE